jgi:hypothetical protein
MNTAHTSFTAFGEPVVSAERKTLTRVAMLTAGPVRGHQNWTDEQFLSDLARLGQSAEHGIKVRFGHPPMCQDAIGTELGVARNWRVEGDTVFADIEFIETPENAKKIAHLLAFAEDAPYHIGNSIEFLEQIPTDEDGNPYMVEYEGKEWLKTGIAELHGTAIVSDPAATNGVFSAQRRLEQRQVATWLSQNRLSVVEMLRANPDLHSLAMEVCLEAEGVSPDEIFSAIK